jgi:hypothetical protein
MAQALQRSEGRCPLFGLLRELPVGHASPHSLRPLLALAELKANLFCLGAC